MSFYTRMLIDDIVYWPFLRKGGDSTNEYGSPVELKGKWIEEKEKAKTDSGEEFMSVATVYVESEIALDGILFKGSLTDLDSNNDPLTQAGSYMIKAADVVQSVTGRTTIYNAKLREQS